ncbi:MAG: hemagglutinin repeat-containing protein [Elusimicrobia bacterium]|nr:hemagglutinin repeat-containing protein [Elusimicrobiota bacterium]
MNRKEVLLRKVTAVATAVFFVVAQMPLQAAGITADGQTNTTIDVTSNGTPMVNIAQPNAQGLSHNTYSDFNVDPNNLVINNSNHLTGVSQTGGYVVGNPNLIGKTEANVVLNEVTSNRISNLNGYIEMYGKAADFILANPNGIAVAGAGFINTPRATLVTGTPNIVNGMVSDFALSPTGAISITGRDVPGLTNLGLDTQSVDLATLVSRVITVSGGIYGKNVHLLSGNDKYSYQTNTVSSTGQPLVPLNTQFGVDSSALGGMYAGRITIVANEAGFGVRTAGDLVSDVDDISITSKGGIEYSKAYARRNLTVQSVNGDVANADYSFAGNDISISGKNVASKYMNASNNISVRSENNTTYGTAEAKNVTVNAGNAITNTSATTALESITLKGKDIEAKELTSGLDLSLIAENSFTNHGNTLSYGDASITAKSLILDPSYKFTAHKNLNLTTETFDNESTFLAGQNITMNATEMTNRGSIQAYGNVLIDGTDIENKTSGHLYAGETLSLTATGSITNNGIAEGDSTDVSATVITNNGKINALTGTLSVSGNTIANNTGAEMNSNGTMNLTAANTLINNGKITSEGDLNLTADTLVSNNLLLSGDDINMNVRDAVNNSEIAAYNNININAAGNVTNNGTGLLLANNNLNISANNLTNSPNGYIYSGNDSLFRISGTLYNNQGLIYAERNMIMRGQGDETSKMAVLTNNAGEISAKTGDLTINANTINNLSIDNCAVPPGSFTVYQTGGPQYPPDPNIAGTGEPAPRTYSVYSNVYAIKQGKILAGNNITMNAGTVRNRSSIVAAQNGLNIYAGTVYNERPAFYVTYTYEEGMSPTTALLYSNTPAAMSGRTVNIQASLICIDAPNTNTGTIPQIRGGTDKQIEQIINTGILQPLIVNGISINPGPGFKLAKPDAGYLFQNNNRFLNEYEFTGSDYFIKRMGFNPNTGTKFLGDAVYEQKIIQDSIIAATGNHYLYDGIVNMNQQMEVLYDNAVSMSGKLGLEFGKPLTEQQIAQLDKDIIWYIEREINGFIVLEPVMYLCKETRDKLGMEGSTIQAKDEVKLASGDTLRNTGTIKGNNVVITAKNNIENIEGRIEAQTNVALLAGNDIKNIGGAIKSSNDMFLKAGGSITSENIKRRLVSYDGWKDEIVSQGSIEAGRKGIFEAAKDFGILGGSSLMTGSDMVINTGGNINITAERLDEKHDTYEGLSEKTRYLLAAVGAGGNLLMRSGGDTNVIGGNVTSTCDLVLNAGGNVNIESVQERDYSYSRTEDKDFWGNSSSEVKESETTRNIASKLNSNRNLTITSGGNTKIKGSDVEALGNIGIETKGNLAIVSGQDTSSSYSKKESSNIIDKNKEETGNLSIKQIASNIKAGGNISTKSGNNTTIIASNVLTERGDVTLDSAGNINMLAGENVTVKSRNQDESGNFGLSESETRERSSKTTLEASNTISGRNINLNANKDFTTVASNVGAAGDAEIEAENVNILAGNEKDEYSYYHREKDLADINIGALYGYGWEIGDGKATVELAKFNERENYSGHYDETAKGSAINIGGNLKVTTSKDVNIIGSDAAADSADVNAKGDIKVASAEEKHTSYEGNKETKITVSAGIGNAYVDAYNAGDALIKAGEEVKKANEALNEMKRLEKEGKASKSAVEDAELNLAMATANLAQATTSLTSSAASAATAASTSLGTGLYADMTVERNGTETRTDKTALTNRGSAIVTNNNLNLKSGNDINQKGSAVSSINGDISYEADGNIAIVSSEDKYNEKTNTKEVNERVSYGSNGVNANVNSAESESRANSVTNNNSIVSAGGNINIKSGNETKIRGGNIEGENIEVDADKLIVESVQDSYYSNSKGGNTGIGLGKNSVNASYGDSSSKVDMQWVNNQSGIVSKGKLDIKATDETTVKGAVIGSQTGDMALATGKLTTEDIDDRNVSEARGLNINTNIGKTGDRQKDSRFPNGSTTVGLKNSANEKEQITKATIGEGTVILNEANDLSGVNRDLSNTQETTKDQITRALDGNVTVDNRVFTEAGREAIVKDFKDLGKNVNQIGKGLTNNVVVQSVKNAVTDKKTNIIEAVKDYVRDDKKIQEIQESKELTDKLNGLTNENAEGVQDSLQKTADISGKDGGFEGNVELYNNSDETKGYSYSKNGENTVGVNTRKTDLTNSGEIINTVFHETTNADKHSQNNDRTALNRGDTAEAIWGLKNFGNENTNTLTNEEWNSLNGNSSVLRTGNNNRIINYFNAGNKLGLLNEMTFGLLNEVTISLPGSTKFITEPPQIDFGPLVTPVSDIISKPLITPVAQPDPNGGKEITPISEPDTKPLITPVPTGDELGTSKPYMELGEVRQTTPEEANKPYTDKGWVAPYKEGTSVTDNKVIGEEKYVRLHGEDNQANEWLVKESEITRSDGTLMSPEEIKNILSLPSIPTKISDVAVPDGTMVRKGTAAGVPEWNTKGGGEQHEILDVDEIKASWFTNERGLK